MKIRYWLIKWLAQGDLILVNAQFTSWGTIRPKEAGGMLVENCAMYGNDIQAIGLDLEPTKSQPVAVFSNLYLERFTRYAIRISTNSRRFRHAAE